MAFSDSTASTVCSDSEADIRIRQLDIDDDEVAPYFDEILEANMPSFWLFLNPSERGEFLVTNWHLNEMIQGFLVTHVDLFPRPDYSQYRVL